MHKWNGRREVANLPSAVPFMHLFNVYASCGDDHEPAVDRPQSRPESSFVADHRTRIIASSFPLPRITYAVERLRVHARKQHCPRTLTVQRNSHLTACDHSAA